MWILLSITLYIPHTALEYSVLIFLKNLLWVLVKVEVLVFDKFFGWLQSTAPYKFISSVLKVVLTWYLRVWKIGKVALWLLFCLLVLPKLMFILLCITVYLEACFCGLYIIFLALFFAILVAYVQCLTIFFKKIIEKGEVCFANNYEVVTVLDVNEFLNLRKTLVYRVLTLTKRLGLSNRLSYLIVRVYIVMSDSLLFLATVLYWSAVFYSVVYCIVKISFLFILVLITTILFSWTVS